MTSKIKKLNYLIGKKNQSRALTLLLLMIVGVSLETLGIGLVVPVIGLLLDGSVIAKYKVLNDIYVYFSSPSQEQLAVISMIFLVCIYLVKNVFLVFLAWMQSHFVFDVQKQVSDRLFNTYLHQTYQFHLQRNSAQLIRNITSETGMLSLALGSAYLIVTESLVVIGVTLLLILIQPIGAFFIAGVLGSAGYFFLKLTKSKMADWGKARQHHDGMRIQHLQQGLAGIKDVILLEKEEVFRKSYQTHNFESARIGGLQSTLQQLPRLGLEFFAILSLAVLVIIMLRDGGNLQKILPTLGLFAAAAFRLIPSANRLLNSIQSFRFSLPVINTLYKELTTFEPKLKPLVNNDYKASQLKEAIKLEGINFTYSETPTKSIENISAEIKKGSFVGFIGSSGSGKSTLVDILMGLLKPQSGQILVDGEDIYSNIRSWQSQIGYVPQSIFLTDDTLRRNIAFGVSDDEVDDMSMQRALESAQLSEFVSKLPAGLNTVVGERGVKLSGGQRQRIGIARALYHDPMVLILDEATSSLDTATEQSVMRAIEALHGEKTIIVVAHRLSTVEHCDYLYRFNAGRLIDQGSPQAVLVNIK